MMKKIFVLFAMALALCACSSQKATEAGTTCVSTLPTGLDLDNLTDATVSASFKTDDFNWMGGNLKMTVYAEQLYDTVELHQLSVGDTLIHNGAPLVVNEKLEENGQITINGGVENGGVELWPYEGGTYRSVTFDEHSVYVELGEITLPLSENFTIIDCREEPQQPSDTIGHDQKLYLENVKEYKKSFSCLDTKVRVENGVITNITRTWIP